MILPTEKIASKIEEELSQAVLARTPSKEHSQKLDDLRGRLGPEEFQMVLQLMQLEQNSLSGMAASAKPNIEIVFLHASPALLLDYDKDNKIRAQAPAQLNFLLEAKNIKSAIKESGR